MLTIGRHLGVGFVAYSPLGGGFLTGGIKRPEDFPPDDFRAHTPRFQGDEFVKNLQLLEKVSELASEMECSPGQLAPAWVLAQGEDIVPIPGTKRRKYIEQNVAAVDLQIGKEQLAAIEAIFPRDAAVGLRYPESRIGGLSA